MVKYNQLTALPFKVLRSASCLAVNDRSVYSASVSTAVQCCRYCCLCMTGIVFCQHCTVDAVFYLSDIVSMVPEAICHWVVCAVVVVYRLNVALNTSQVISGTVFTGQMTKATTSKHLRKPVGR